MLTLPHDRFAGPTTRELATVTRLPLPPHREAPPPRRRRPRPGDPFVQGLVAVIGAAVCAIASGVTTAAGHVLLGRLVFVVALASAAGFLVLVARAMTRDRLGHMRERRDLRLARDLAVARANLLATAVRRMHGWRSGGEPQAQQALAELVDRGQKALAARYGDVAVLLVLELHRRWQVCHAAAEPGSRWRELVKGKRCPMHALSAEEKLRALARHHRAFAAPIQDGRVLLAVLCQSPLDASGEGCALLCDLEACFDLLAAHWSREAPPQSTDLHTVG